MNNKNWIAIGAASALSIGVLASGAATVANAMPLIENATGLSLPGLDTLQSGNGSADVDFSVTSDSIVSPASSDSPVSLTSADSAVSADSPASPASVNSPASPASVDSPASPASVNSPASIDSPASPASIASPASVDSVD